MRIRHGNAKVLIPNKTKTILAAALVLSLAPGLAGAATSIVLGAPASSLAPSSGSWAFDGSYFLAYRAAITNLANFGPSGTVKVSITPTNLSSITAATLSTVNVFMSPWWDNGDSSSYNQLVVNYFKAGGSLILLDDSTQQDGVAALLGIPTLGQADGSVENGSTPLFSGPFGTATNVLQSAQIGYLAASSSAASAITSRGGFVCGTNGSGQVTAACWAAGAYSAGSGAMIIVADVDTWTTQASYGPLNSNGIFALNGTAYIASAAGSVSTSTPTTVPALSNLALICLALLLISAAMFYTARTTTD